VSADYNVTTVEGSRTHNHTDDTGCAHNAGAQARRAARAVLVTRAAAAKQRAMRSVCVVYAVHASEGTRTRQERERQRVTRSARARSAYSAPRAARCVVRPIPFARAARRYAFWIRVPLLRACRRGAASSVTRHAPVTPKA